MLSVRRARLVRASAAVTAWALYSEIDPFAAAWLNKLIGAGHIMPGVVDTRSLEDLTPDECREFTQVHLCAGIGVWSYALRLAGWDDHRACWTARFPCQPFSAAGKGAAFADERHIWPSGHWLIDQCRPPVVFGEQVASKYGLAWLDVVSADLEASGYAFGAADLCAAGVGAPHIRQRSYWVADTINDGQRQYRNSVERTAATGRSDVPAGAQRLRADPADGGVADRLEHSARNGRQQGRTEPIGRGASSGCGVERLGDDDDARLGGLNGHGDYRNQSGRIATEPVRSSRTASGIGRLADTDGRDAGTERQSASREYGQQPQDGCVGGVGDTASSRRQHEPSSEPSSIQHRPITDARGGSEFSGCDTGLDGTRPAGPTNGLWRDADWLYCRDGKWRPVEPGTFPLAHGVAARVGQLRGYGNAIVAPVAQAFVEAVMAS